MQGEKVPMRRAGSDCLQTPNDVFKGNYQHNWRNLFVLLFSQSREKNLNE